MNADEIRAFSQPTWELYRECVLSVPGNDEGDVEGRIIYEAYHRRVMSRDYRPVGILIITN